MRSFPHLCNTSDVDSSWLLWSKEAEASLARAYVAAGGPPFLVPVVISVVALCPCIL